MRVTIAQQKKMDRDAALAIKSHRMVIFEDSLGAVSVADIIKDDDLLRMMKHAYRELNRCRACYVDIHVLKPSTPAFRIYRSTIPARMSQETWARNQLVMLCEHLACGAGELKVSGDVDIRVNLPEE